MKTFTYSMIVINLLLLAFNIITRNLFGGALAIVTIAAVLVWSKYVPRA